MKPLKYLHSNSPLLILLTNIISIKLAENLQIILLGRILLLSYACCKWPSPWALLCSAASKTQIQTSQMLPVCIVNSISNLTLQCCVWWGSGLNSEWSSSSQLDLFICWMLRGGKRATHLLTHKKETFSNNIQACNSHVCRMQPNVPVIRRDPKSTEPTRSFSNWFLDQLHNIQDYFWSWRHNIEADRGQELHSCTDNRSS